MKDKIKILGSERSNLCMGCGTCVSLCPKDAIKMKINEKKGVYLPEIDYGLCNNCQICLKVCPGHEVDFRKLDKETLGKHPEDQLIGDHLCCYTGSSTTQEIRYNCSSGGLVTQILIYALEKKIIDGALVTKMKKHKPLEPEPFIARTKDEIIEASKSKYCPVPVNIVLKDILNSKKEQRFAVVGLPCHIRGIRAAEQMNRKLKEKIVLHLGLFCDNTPNFWGTELFLKKRGINKDNVTDLNYRGKGWPGSMNIVSKDEEIDIKLSEYYNFIGSSFFVPVYCLICTDGANELADISLADAWLPEFKSDKTGRSLIVTRNEMGEKLIKSMMMENIIFIEKLRQKKVVQSQLLMLYQKKMISNACCKLVRINSNNPTPLDLIDYAFASFRYINSCVALNSNIKALLPYVPSKVLYLYEGLYMRICSNKAKKRFRA